MRIKEFITQVKQEVQKVTWPTQKETLASTFMVMVMVALASVFFLLVDLLVFNTLQWVLG